MAIEVKPLTVPPAGIDVVKITIEETYEVEGVGKDTVTLHGRLVANRTVPLVGPEQKVDWNTSAVIAQFTDLDVAGHSKVFGPVHVTLDKTIPSYGLNIGCHCRAAIGVVVGIPQHGLTLRSSAPLQLKSEVTTVPPVGDENTESVLPVDLIDAVTDRKRGSLERVRVLWRELTEQKAHVAPKF
jgi:hypothetical protein